MNRDDGVFVRSATPDDAEEILRVHTASIRQLCAPHYSRTLIEDWIEERTTESYREAMVGGIEKMFVALIEERVVGFGSIKGDFIMAIYVAPNCTGYGVGSRLLEAVEEVARVNQIGTIRLTSSRPALGFYLRHGYSKMGEKTYRLRTGRLLPCIEMRKELS